jgi:serine phosphatase RsbU (regulator of sigma subunit)
VEELGADCTGPPLGCDASTRYRAWETKLEPGDVVLMHTDGISEAMNPEKQLFGVARVRRALGRGPQALVPLCRSLLDEVQEYRGGGRQNDDICLIGVQREPCAAP